MTMQQYTTAMVAAWISHFKEMPSKEAIGVLYAQFSLETGGGVSAWNFNIGNRKYQVGHPYYMLDGTFEYVNGVKIVYHPPSPVTWFRAFFSLEEGVLDHLIFLSEQRYKSCWDSVLSGNVLTFAAALKNKGYFTATAADYSAGMRPWFSHYMSSNAYENAKPDRLASDSVLGDAAIDEVEKLRNLQ